MKIKRISITLFTIALLSAGLFVACTSNSKEEKKETKASKADSSEKQLWTCGMHPEVILDHPGQCPKCGMNLVPVKTTVTDDPNEKPEMQMEQNKQNEKLQPDTQTQLYTCPMHPDVISDKPGQCPKCGMNLVPVKKQSTESHKEEATSKAKGKGKILYWQAPMDPTEIYDHPGKSKMGMDLVPVYESQVSKGKIIKIDPATVQNMGVRTVTIERQDFSRTIRTVGKIEYDEKKVFVISSKISGWVEELDVNATGQAVRKGQTLLKIYSPELVTTQQEYLLALKNQQNMANSSLPELKQSANDLLQASFKRLLYWDIPKSQIERLKETGKIQKLLAFESPVNGVVIHKNVVQGMFVKKGSDLYRIADLSKVWVLATVYDNEAPWLEPGQPVKIRLSYEPGTELTGHIDYIYPYLNDKTRSVQVRIVLANPDLTLKPGMFTDVYLQQRTIPDAIVIPSEAVIRSGKRNVVFVARGKGRFEPRTVRLGAEDGNGHLHVLAGLQPGEKIVVSAQFMLDSESRLQEAIRKMIAEKQKNAG